ncbi:MAG: phage head morphogenesis protein [Armatimonadota bacterium]
MSTTRMLCTVADINSQKEAIRAATDKSLLARDMYTEQVVYQLTQSFQTSQEQVQKSILKYKNVGSLPDNKLAALNGLDKLNAEIADAMKALRKDQTLMFRKATEASFKSGIYRGIEEFATAQMPFYRDLTPQGIDKLTTSVFTLVDTDALDFMANYNFVLAGDVHRELSDGIKKTILSGIATGKGVEGIVADMGKVIEDKESFRHAGSKVFSKAQYRMETIARTEVLRAHNQGRIKFHQQVGVQKLEWLAMDDERMCPVCGGYDGKVFDTDKFPNQPAHVLCRCSSVVAWPLVICGGELGAVAADGAPSCILPPQAIEQQAKQKSEEEAKLKSAFDSGEIADLSVLTVNQLQTLAKQNGIAIARTKADFIKLLDIAEPGIHHNDLSGAVLTAKVKQYNIGALRSKDDLVDLLASKQAAVKQAKALEEAAKKAMPQGGLQGMTMVQLKDMAKDQGISFNLTKSEVIDMLDVLEPGIDHSNIAGKALIAAKQKYNIPPLKNKEQMVKALEKSAGAQMAEVAKQKALETAKIEALKKAEQSLKDAAEKVVIPSSVNDYASFLESVKAAESELIKDSGLPGSVIEIHAKEVALKKLMFQKQVASMNSGQVKDLAKTTKVKHWQWASKDELVTLLTETDPDKVASALSGIEAKHSKWAEKHLGGKSGKVKPVSQPVATPVSPKPKITESPVFAKKGSAFDSVDDAWSQTGKPTKFKYLEKANVGGAHEKEFWIDESGDKWMFKPVAKQSDAFIAHGEEVGYKIGRLIDPDAIEVRVITLNGRTGSIQKWKTNLASKYDFSGVDVIDMLPDELAFVQREHVIDWLISNHDGHCKQFLRSKDGKVYGIDKGQLFKFLGSDKLDIDYHPNQVCGEQEPFYNTVFRAVKGGKVKTDPSVTLKYIREVEKISDDDYLSLLRPYVEGRFGTDELKKKAFYDLALSRKHNLRSDFESFYADVLNKPGFRFDDVVSIPDKSVTARIGKAEESIIHDVQRLGWQGKCLPIDETDIEDQNALIFTEKTAKGERTVIKLKLRPEAQPAVLEKLRSAERQIVKIGEPLQEDDFADDILAAVKTVNHHSGDGSYNQGTLDKAGKHLSTLRKLAKSSDPDTKAMADDYIAWLKKVENAVEKRQGIPEKFNQYLKKHVSDTKKIGSDFTTRKTKVYLTKRSISKGELGVESEASDITSMFGKRPMPDGEQYEIDFGDGVKAVYRPWGSKNLYAHSGELEMVIPERPDAKSVEMALERMEQIGIKANIASPEDAEILYLHKQAYVTKSDRDQEYTKMVASLDNRNASKTERVQTMRAFWEKKLGVRDITKMPGYDPIGEYQHGFKDRSITGGYRHQYRFDISDEQLEKDMAGYSLYHNLTNGSSMSGFLDTALGNNGAMISTVEKLRSGVMPGGMSPEEDMRSGGASYVFTRIKKSPLAGGERNNGLYLKKRLLRRMDAISYDHDAYGKVIDDYVTQHRGFSPKEWKRYSQNSGNETILKYSVTLLDNLEHIVVSSATEHNKVMDVFKKYGISVLPDGRKIEEVVLIR